MEGRRTIRIRRPLLNAASQGGVPTLASLEGSWMGLSAIPPPLAYAWSLAAVESIIQTGSIADISRLMDAIDTAPNTEQALRDTLHDDYSDLQQQAIVLLRHEDVAEPPHLGFLPHEICRFPNARGTRTGLRPSSSS